MVMVDIPSMAEVGTGMSLVANGACELASHAVQQFVSSPSIAQAGLHALAAQIEVLEHLVAMLREVAAGIDEVRTMVASLQTLLATARAAVGDVAPGAIDQVCA